jgi:hypothetical protein
MTRLHYKFRNNNPKSNYYKLLVEVPGTDEGVARKRLEKAFLAENWTLAGVNKRGVFVDNVRCDPTEEFVSGYFRDDGIYVHGFCRKKEAVKNDNICS